MLICDIVVVGKKPYCSQAREKQIIMHRFGLLILYRIQLTSSLSPDHAFSPSFQCCKAGIIGLVVSQTNSLFFQKRGRGCRYQQIMYSSSQHHKNIKVIVGILHPSLDGASYSMYSVVVCKEVCGLLSVKRRFLAAVLWCGCLSITCIQKDMINFYYRYLQAIAYSYQLTCLKDHET